MFIVCRPKEPLDSCFPSPVAFWLYLDYNANMCTTYVYKGYAYKAYKGYKQLIYKL